MVSQITFKEAETGRNKQVIVIAVVMLLCILPGLGHAADELFDTEAATTLAQIPRVDEATSTIPIATSSTSTVQ